MLKVDRNPDSFDYECEEVTESEYIFRRLKEAGKTPSDALANLIDVLAEKRLFTVAEIQKIAGVDTYTDKEEVKVLR